MTTPTNQALTVTDVEVRFGSTLACGPVSFSVAAGESLAIVGASGSGKTSLLLAAAGLLEPDSGIVMVAGASLWDSSKRDRARLRRRSLGYVAQFGDLIPELTLAENVALPLRLLGTPAAKAYQAAERRMDQLGIASLRRRFPDEVSGGELQRAALARCLVHDPAVVLADEPTAALDEDNRLLVTQQLLDAARLSGCAVVLVTHDQSLAAAADRVVMMDAGLFRDPS